MTARSEPDPNADVARRAWLRMSDLVLANERRRAVAEALGMSFGRARAVRRVARRPMSMSELAESLGIDRPNATTLVDSLEDQGLVRRRPHPTDRRAKIVEATRKGKALARRADEILGTPPAALSALDARDLDVLDGILERISASKEAEPVPVHPARGPQRLRRAGPDRKEHR